METGVESDTHQELLSKLSKLEEQILLLTNELKTKQLDNIEFNKIINDQQQQITKLEDQLNSNLSPLFLKSYRHINGQLALIPDHINWHKISENLAPIETWLATTKSQLITMNGNIKSAMLTPVIQRLENFLAVLSRYFNEIKRYVPNWIRDPLEEKVEQYTQQAKRAYDHSVQYIETGVIRPLLELLDIAIFKFIEFYKLAKESISETGKNLIQKTRTLTNQRDESSKEGGTISRQPLTHLHA